MNGARAFLLQLKACGIDYIFANPGSEFIPLIEEYAKGGDFPKAITVPHESLAVSMAHGYYLATGRPQAVMVHVTVGTANALIGLIGAHHMDIPVLFLGGRTPVREEGGAGSRDRFVHWAQESFDQAGLAREFCKWSYELRDAGQTNLVLKRAYEMMTEGVRGPVQVLFSRELFFQDAALFVPLSPAPEISAGAALPGMPDDFKKGLVITSRTGLDTDSVEALEAFCDFHQMGVITPQAQAVNIRSRHPCYLGFENNRALAEADFILVLDTDVPWLPHKQRPSDQARIMHVGRDPLFRKIPLRSFRSDLNVTADVTAWLKSQCTEKGRAPSPWVAGLREEFVIQKARDRQRSGDDRALSPSQIAVALGKQPELTVFNELSLPAELLDFDGAGCYFRSGSASALGWALGCAAGFKLARPQAVPVSVVGDGVYYLSNPLAAHWLAQKAPSLTVILNNGGMRSVHALPHFTDLSPSLDFAADARAAGRFAATATTPSEFEHALQTGAACVREGQWGVIDARLGK